MNRDKEIRNICTSVLCRKGTEDRPIIDIAEEITAKILAEGYVRFDSVELDPQRLVQLLATILNGFKAEHPLCIVEKAKEKEKITEENNDNANS